MEVNLTDLRREQEQLAKRVVVNNVLKKVELIAGVEVLGVDNTKLV